MKKLLFVLLPACLLISCDKLDELTQFTMKYETTYQISSSTGINLPISLASPDIETNSESAFRNNNANRNKVEEVYLRQMILNITSPAGGDFSFLSSIEIFINADGLSEQPIASKNDIAENVGSQLELETSGVDIQEYIKKEEFSLRMNVVTDEVISEDYTIIAESEFFVDAEVL